MGRAQGEASETSKPRAFADVDFFFFFHSIYQLEKFQLHLHLWDLWSQMLYYWNILNYISRGREGRKKSSVSLQSFSPCSCKSKLWIMSGWLKNMNVPPINGEAVLHFPVTWRFWICFSLRYMSQQPCFLSLSICGCSNAAALCVDVVLSPLQLITWIVSTHV